MNSYRAEHFLKGKYAAHEKIADLYDGDEELQAAIAAMFPNFEYPNFSHMTIGEVLGKFDRAT